MIENDKRVRIICGHYGCGKTEFAVNYAVKLAEAGLKPVLADIDIINPYFRSRERTDALERMGVRVVASSINAPSIDVPAVSAGVYSAFDGDSAAVVDVGGDSSGMSVLKSFSGHFSGANEYDLFFVININREAVSTTGKILEYIKSFEKKAGLSVTGLINNTHMLKSTTVEDLLNGAAVSEEVSSATGIPVLYHSGLAGIKDGLPDEMKERFFPLELYMRDDWMS